MRVVSPLDIEGLALNGFVEEFRLEDCGVNGGARLCKLIAKLKNGDVVMTECMEYPRISRVYLLLIKYKDWVGSFIRNEGVMSGITYDLRDD